MTAAIWGLVTALSWGTADFIARFTGRALGHRRALLGMFAVGSVLLPLAMLATGEPLVLDPSGWWLVTLAGVAIMAATLLLYLGLTRGPVTIVAPIVGSYPVLNVALAFALGSRPTAVQWAAMAAVLAGVVAVARAARSFEHPESYSRRHLRRSVLIAFASAAAFALAVATAQRAIPIYGELQTVWLTRWVGLAAILLLMAWRREAPRIPRRAWPLLALQGALDAGAYVALLMAGHGPGSEIAVVVASTFSAVTVVLAWVVLREAVTVLQWTGIAAILAGVAALAAEG